MKNFFLLISFSILFSSAVLAYPQITSLSMERTPCFGVCPNYKITINADGKIFYEGKKGAPRIGKFEGQLNKKEAQKILKKFAKKNVNKAPNEYKTDVRDVSFLNYYFTINTENKTVKKANYGPAYFESFAKEIDALAEKINWQKAIDNDLE